MIAAAYFILSQYLNLKKMFQVPEKFRVVNHPNPKLSSTKEMGNNGIFVIPLSASVMAYIVCSDGQGWKHVSAHILDRKMEGNSKERTPTWAEMCKIKDSFWTKDECVVQYHPPETEYVNNHKHTLHLWQPTEVLLPMPPAILVGYKEPESH